MPGWRGSCSDSARSASPRRSALTISLVWWVASSQRVCGNSRRHAVIASGSTLIAMVGVDTRRTVSTARPLRLAARRRMPCRSRLQLFGFDEQAVRFRLRIQLAAHALEQRHAQLQLGVLQHLGHRRLRDVQHLGGAADGADLHDGVENFYVTQPHRFIPCMVGARSCADGSQDSAKPWPPLLSLLDRNDRHGRWRPVLHGVGTGAITGAGTGRAGDGTSASSMAAVSASGVPSMVTGRYFIWKAVMHVARCLVEHAGLRHRVAVGGQLFWNHGGSGSCCSKRRLRGGHLCARPATAPGRAAPAAYHGNIGPGSCLRCGAMSAWPRTFSGGMLWSLDDLLQQRNQGVDLRLRERVPDALAVRRSW